MNHQYYNVLGVMSGTSLDGIDIAHIQLRRKNKWSFTIRKAQCIPYPAAFKEELKKAIDYNDDQLADLNQRYTQFLATVINQFIKEHHVKDLLAICSHGHTIKHEPEHGYTLQIGNLKKLATLVQHRVICDFRIQDVALGGQGAPLVPIGDRLLFNDYDYCLNLGGFSNLSYESNGSRLAYDLSPVNVVMNHYAQLLGKEYDEDGAFAKAGTLNNTLLQKLNALDYYHREPPKSLGVEWVSKFITPLLSGDLDPKDVLRTFTEHTAVQIARHLKGNKRVLCTGGGSYNKFLVQRIAAHTDCELILPDPLIIDYKEALIFALLGVLRLRNANNCLASVTGATQDHCSGMIFNP
jgi:anhydro-N-acetylmuramic acid kinase